MTIQAILKRAMVLAGIPEGSVSADSAKERLLAALDSALGELSRCFPIQARSRIKVAGGSIVLPATVLSPRALLREGKRIPLVVNEGQLLVEDGEYTLVYYRVPPEASTMDESVVLPYPEDILRALPFYCAAVYAMGEDYPLYLRLMEQYNTKLASALGYRPAAIVEAGGSV